MQRSRRRLGSFVLVAVAVGAAVAAVGPASPALAGGVLVDTCPPGSWTSSVTGLCYNSSSQTPLKTPNGDPIGTRAGALDNPTKVKNLSSAIKATGATTGENVAAAEATAAANGGRLATAGRLATTVGGRVVPALGAFATGYQVGTWLAQGSCAVGVDALCMPKNGSATPNTDAAPAGSPGISPAGFFPTASHCNSAGACTSLAGVTFAGLTYAAQTNTRTATDDSQVKSTFTFTKNCANPSDASCSVGATLTWQAMCKSTAGAALVGNTLGSGLSYNGAGTNWQPGNYTRGNTLTAAYLCPQSGSTFDYLRGYQVSSTNESAATGYWCSNPNTCVYWYPPGHPLRPADVATDPQRNITVTNTCLNPDGTTTTKTAVGAAFTEATVTAVPFPKTVDPCPAGSVVSHSDVAETGAGVPSKSIGAVDVPKGMTDQSINYPACTNGACQLTLFKTSGSALLDCSGTNGLCTGWFTDPNKSSTYTCKYGPAGAASDATVDLSECNVYAPSFDPEKTAQCQFYGSPVDGSITSGNQCNTPGNTTVGDAGGGAPCFPSGWGSFNPLNWVLQPVKCALVWAFKPDMATLAPVLSSTWSTVSARPPVNVALAVVPVLTGFVTGAVQGCNSNIANFGGGLIVPCSVPGSPPWWQAFYLVCQVAIVGSTAFGLWRLVEGALSKQ